MLVTKAQYTFVDSFNSISGNSDYTSKFYTQTDWKIITVNKSGYPKKTSYMYQTVVPGSADDYLRYPLIKFKTTTSDPITTVSSVSLDRPAIMMTQDHESAYQYQKKTNIKLLGNDITLFHYYLKQSDIMRKELNQTLKKNYCYKFYVTVYHPKCNDTITTGMANWTWLATQSEYLQKEFVPDIVLAADSNIKWEYLDSATGVQNNFTKAVCTNAYLNGSLNKWVTLEYTYQAKGNERYLFLGSIYPNLVSYPVLDKFLGKTLDDEQQTLVAMKKSTALRSVTLFSRFEMVELAPLKLINDTLLCRLQPIELKDLNFNPTSSYTWSSGEKNFNLMANNPGSFILTKQTGICIERDTVKIQIINKSNYTIVGKDKFCEGDSVKLTIQNPLSGLNYLWNDGRKGSSNVVYSEGVKMLITKAGSCLFKDSISVVKIAMPKPLNFTDTIFCAAVNLKLDLTNNAENAIWADNGLDQKQRTISEKGNYKVQLINGGLCAVDQAITIELQHAPKIPFNDTSIPCAGEKVVFQNFDLSTKYVWNNSVESNKFEIVKSGTVSIQASNFCGVDTKEVKVSIGTKLCGLYIPNAFTPNRDGVNDEFKLVNDMAIDQFEMKIYNQWGQKIYHGTSIQSGWNGKDLNGNDCMIGVYVVEISGRLISSETSFTSSSTLNLLR